MQPIKPAVNVVLLLGILLAGCVSTPAPDRTKEAVHCYKSKLEHYKRGPCTSGPVPSLDADAMAKRFEPDPDAFVVYVVRQSWADGTNLVHVRADTGAEIETLPDTLVRLRLRPGAHTLSLAYDGQREQIRTSGSAGDVKLLRLAGSGWSWHVKYQWAEEPADELRVRALRTRLVADVKAF